MIYQWRPGFYPGVKAEDAVPRLMALRKRKGHLSPSDVVADAKAKTSPLHPCFEWDNAEAGEQWRLLQARQLIGACVMIADDAAEEVEPVRCFVSVDRGEDETDYTPLNALLTEMAENPETREQMLSRAIRDARIFRRQYGHLLPELNELFEAIAHLDSAVPV